MRDQTSLEITAPNVEKAIEQGLAQLNAARDEVEIEILDEGSRGILGLGVREAVVRLSLLYAPTEDVREAEEEEAEEEEISPKPEADYLPRICQETLIELLDKMGLHPEVSIRDPSKVLVEEGEIPPIVLDVLGPDLGILIGRRGETLNTLQYVTRLIVSREVQHWVNVVVDVEHYKVRREQKLRQLAQRMAERVALSHQPVALEPMPPNERRIIHIELRGHPIVTTQSVGKGDGRKVTIIPREE